MLNMNRAVFAQPHARRWLSAAAGLAFGFAATYPTAAEDTIKIGILHSLSGTMAISETTLKDTMLFLIDEQNKKGGVLGKKLEALGDHRERGVGKFSFLARHAVPLT